MNIEQSPKKYHSNHSIVYSCQYHVIFCPKYRRKIFHPPLDTRLKELILEKQQRYGYRVLGMEVMPDHVHLLSMWTRKSVSPRLWDRSRAIRLMHCGKRFHG